ncbi:MAG TPA: hypothetical protein PLA94_28610, partial [Myxococcota bacterium]|nr:hypothetical protein [Myxococcota bacterium]
AGHQQQRVGAGALAQLAVTRWELRVGGTLARRDVRAILGKNLWAHLLGLSAFDRMEQGPLLTRLPVRRLRRYLIWGLQAARAETVHEPAAVSDLLGERLFVELAPLPGRLDGRGEKLVEEGGGERERLLRDTQLFLTLGGRLLRLSRMPQNFAPLQLVEMVRRQDLRGLLGAQAHVVDQDLGLLAPWT